MTSSSIDMDQDPQQLVFQSEANVYALLSRLWIAELDAESLTMLKSDGLRESYEELGGFVPSEDVSPGLIEELAIEFCGCFLGPKNHLPPHQSVVSQSRFQGKCIDSMNTFVEIVGKPKGALFEQQKLVDHAGVQLAIIGSICASQVSPSIEDQDSLEELKQSFFENHLLWLIGYCRVAVSKTQSDFYQGLFRVTEAFLEPQ